MRLFAERFSLGKNHSKHRLDGAQDWIKRGHELSDRLLVRAVCGRDVTSWFTPQLRLLWDCPLFLVKLLLSQQVEK